MTKYPKNSSNGRPGHSHRVGIQPNIQSQNQLIRPNYPMEYQPLVPPNVPMGVSLPTSIDGIPMDKNMVMFGGHQMGMNWQHIPHMKQHHLSPMPMMPMPPLMMIPKSGVNVVLPHMCNINPQQMNNNISTPSNDGNRRLYATRNRCASQPNTSPTNANYSDKQSNITKNMALDMQLQSLVAMSLSKMYQTHGFWISLTNEREIIECLKKTFLERLSMLYKEACKFHQYSLDLEKKNLSVKKSSIIPDQDLKPLTEYFWHKGRMERIMKNYKNIAKLAIEQKEDDKSDKDKGTNVNSESDANNSGSLNSNFTGQLNSLNISRVSPNVMQTIEYSEVAYNQRILLAKINLQNIRATLSSEKCIKAMPAFFRHSQLNIIESMLSRS